MADRNITLRLDELWYDALEQHLSGGVQAAMDEALAKLVSQLPGEVHDRIEQEISGRQAGGRNSVCPLTGVRVTEGGKSRCFQIAQSVEIMSFSSALRAVQRGGTSQRPSSSETISLGRRKSPHGSTVF